MKGQLHNEKIFKRFIQDFFVGGRGGGGGGGGGGGNILVIY